MRLVRTFWRIVAGIVKEISDESAYERYLVATGRTHSAAEWRCFWDARMRRKYHRAKCC